MKQRFIKIPKKGTKHGYKIKCNLCDYEFFPKLKQSIICPRCRQNLSARYLT